MGRKIPKQSLKTGRNATMKHPLRTLYLVRLKSIISCFFNNFRDFCSQGCERAICGVSRYNSAPVFIPTVKPKAGLEGEPNVIKKITTIELKETRN
jgi:hypothetical protein